MKHLKSRITERTPTYGVWMHIASASIAEATVHAGFPLVLIDNEHGPASLETTLGMMRAIEAAGGEAIVRVPSSDPIYLKRILELGPSGLLVPQIDSAEEAAATVAACRYPPHGRRGFARAIRAARYGQRPDYVREAHDELTLMLQVETRAALDNLEAIAAVAGIDVLFIGPYDLSGAIGQLGETGGAEVLEAIARIENVARDKGLALGTVPRATADANQLFAMGYSLVMGTSDVAALMAGLQAEAETIPQAARSLGPAGAG